MLFMPLRLIAHLCETPLEWILLTTVVVASSQMAATILRWYSYRWRVEEYHKILKSGCQVERYRLAADGMKTLIGFLSVIAVEMSAVNLSTPYQPDSAAIEILNSLQIQVLKAKSPKLPKVLTLAWALNCDRGGRGGYLEHRCKTPIGIQVL